MEELKEDPNNKGVYDCKLNSTVVDEVRFPPKKIKNLDLESNNVLRNSIFTNSPSWRVITPILFPLYYNFVESQPLTSLTFQKYFITTNKASTL